MTLTPLYCMSCEKEFVQDKQMGRRPVRCPICRAAHKRYQDAEKSKRWRLADPERQKAYSKRHHEKRKDDPAFRQYKRDNELRRVYGLTREQLDAMLEAQNHRCAICGGERTGPGTRLHVDHCHETGRVRGLLCSKCNTVIGLAGEDPARLMQAAIYLEMQNQSC